MPKKIVVTIQSSFKVFSVSDIANKASEAIENLNLRQITKDCRSLGVNQFGVTFKEDLTEGQLTMLWEEFNKQFILVEVEVLE